MRGSISEQFKANFRKLFHNAVCGDKDSMAKHAFIFVNDVGDIAVHSLVMQPISLLFRKDLINLGLRPWQKKGK